MVSEASFQYHNEPEKPPIAYNDKGLGDPGMWATSRLRTAGSPPTRKNFMIISGGVNIYPGEIENLLVGHDKIADVAVFGIPNEEFGGGGQGGGGAYELGGRHRRPPIEIMEWLRERLSHIKMPRSLDFHPKLPRMDSGKLYTSVIWWINTSAAAARDRQTRSGEPAGRLGPPASGTLLQARWGW